MKKWLFLLFIPFTSLAQTWTWGVKATGSHQMSSDLEIVADYEGNTVAAGYFQKELILGDYRLYTEDDYYSDLFMAGFSKDGKVNWARQIEAGSSYGNQVGLATDDDRNIYLTGAYNGYIFAAKYDSTGTEIWKNHFDFKYNGYGASIATDQYDNVYLIGTNGWSFIAARLNYYGNVDWIRKIEVNYSDGFAINNMKVDKDGNMYFAGTFNYNPIQLDTILIAQKGSAIWGKLSPQGRFSWVKTSTGSVNNARIAITGNTLYLSGSFRSEMKIGGITLPGLCCSNPKPFIARFDTAGNQVWAKLGYTTYESKGAISDIKTDLDGNLYVTGGYFTCYGVHCTEGDYFLEKYNSSGMVQWRQEFKSPNGDSSAAIDFDGNGNLYNLGKTMASNFIDQNSESASNSFGVGKLATGKTTRKRSSRPRADRVQYSCNEEGLTVLKANGNQLKWYSDAPLRQLVHEGAEYTTVFKVSDTLYVTQTTGTTESLPKQIIVYKPSLDSAIIQYCTDTLSVPYDELVGYQWYYNGDKIVNARHHQFVPTVNGRYEVEIRMGDCSQRLEFNFQRPAPPLTDSLRYVCPDETKLTLTAEGENIVWYSSTMYTDTIAVGNSFQPQFTNDTKVYVRQTVNGIVSYPQSVALRFSQIKDTVINKGPSFLMVAHNHHFRYNWYYNEVLLPDSAYRIDVTKNGRYRVTISDSVCSRTLTTYFVKQPVTTTTRYFLCPGDTLPEIKVEGTNVIWLSVNFATYKLDTVARGLSYRPTSEQTSIYVLEQEMGNSSYPLLISLNKAKFSSIEITSYGAGIYLSTEYNYGYNYSWYLNNDTVPVSTYGQLSNALYGNYRLHVNFNNQCDTTIHYRHAPTYDSIQYLCWAHSPQLYIAPVNFNWYSDSTLTHKLNTGYYFYPSVISRDTIFYMAQQQNAITYWKGKIELRYPNLGAIRLNQHEDRLELSPTKSYYRYQWEYNNQQLADTGSYCHPSEDGLYTVTISAGECITSLNHQFIRTSARSATNSTSFQLWPNPATTSVELKGISAGPVNLRIVTPNGQSLLKEQLQSLPARIDLRQVPPGVYFLEISDETGRITEKLIKQ